MKVYMLEHLAMHEANYLIGVFSSNERAEQRKQELLTARLPSRGGCDRQRRYYKDNLYVTEIEVDK